MLKRQTLRFVLILVSFLFICALISRRFPLNISQAVWNVPKTYEKSNQEIENPESRNQPILERENIDAREEPIQKIQNLEPREETIKERENTDSREVPIQERKITEEKEEPIQGIEYTEPREEPIQERENTEPREEPILKKKNTDHMGEPSLEKEDNETRKAVCQRVENSHQLLILVWTWPFGETFPLDTCESVYGITGCKLTADRRLYNQADAVIIHHYDIMYDKTLLPREPRPRHQRWVWFNLEPPMITENLNMMDHLVNMTMTYRQDSDVFLPYGWLKILKEPYTFSIPSKSKLVAWVVSKWYPGARRIQYYEELKKHIQIDVYGRNHQKLIWEDFYSTIGQYKFYLAFENSNHRDYITEKLWENSFGTGAVPVVLGSPRENYERFIPSNSFIHVDDFSSPEELAAFLLELDKDNERYQQYFSWRSSYEVVREIGWDNHYCKACKALHQSRGYQVIPSVAKWFA